MGTLLPFLSADLERIFEISWALLQKLSLLLYWKRLWHRSLDAWALPGLSNKPELVQQK